MRERHRHKKIPSKISLLKSVPATMRERHRHKKIPSKISLKSAPATMREQHSNACHHRACRHATTTRLPPPPRPPPPRPLPPSAATATATTAPVASHRPPRPPLPRHRRDAAPAWSTHTSEAPPAFLPTNTHWKSSFNKYYVGRKQRLGGPGQVTSYQAGGVPRVTAGSAQLTQINHGH
ncbi:hypothetical protein C8J57DRAFT_1638101 [Mycena rebaudengoi]|nr:hypothetical protein C8J57DRAFT_1638101 [Mycena rebaudengoi]